MNSKPLRRVIPIKVEPRCALTGERFYDCFCQQPAGQFKVLGYTNTIDFVNADSARADSKRREIVWFAPDVGRWAARESNGSYYLDDSVVDQPFLEAATAGNCWDGPGLLAAARASFRACAPLCAAQH
jgi:hypothetical protein